MTGHSIRGGGLAASVAAAAATTFLLLLFAAPAAALRGRQPHWMSLATSSTGAVVLGAAYEDGVYLSKDSGRTFSRVPIVSNCSLCGPTAFGRDDGCQFAAVAASSNANLMFAAGVYDGCVALPRPRPKAFDLPACRWIVTDD